MNAFFCALRLDGRPISKRELFAYLARLPKQEWESCGDGAFSGVALHRKHALRPLVEQYRGVTGVGDVRLDNRAELLGLTSCDESVSDLAVVLALVDKLGSDAVRRIHGDFSFVSWDARARKIVAARDAFGVKPLFYRRVADHLLLSSRLEPLCGDESLDAEYVADFLIGMPGPSPRTIWQGTLQLEPGAMLVQRGSVTAQSRYWSARSYEPQATFDEVTAVEEFRRLFLHSIEQRVSGGETWAQLSGGLDSSAIVAGAEWLRERTGASGLGGTVTITDSLGTGDERQFSDLVTARYGLANDQVRDYWPWRSDSKLAPNSSDEPNPLFPFFARDQRMVDIVTNGGGKVLLSGLGSDHYMFGSLSYMADMFARGAIRDGAREVLGWAMQMRRSFWHTAHQNVWQPLVQNVRRTANVNAPRWMRSDFAERHQIVERIADVRAPKAKLGSFYATQTATEVARVSNWVQRGVFQDRLEVRYPFLSRSLVEFTLKLPVQLKVRPEARKWVLREAMRDILPERVRTRAHKGGIDARILWTLHHEQPLIDGLLRDPVLAQLGYVEPNELRHVVDLARQGAWHNTVHVLSVLALESWLRARNNAWPTTLMAAQTAA